MGGDDAMTSAEDHAPAAEVPEHEHLLLDQLSERLDTLKLIRGGKESDAVLEEFGAKGKVEHDMLVQLGAWKPLYRPDRFEEAHRTVMRALEVFDRNAARPPSSIRLGPLTPVAAYVVQLFVRLIVRDHQKRVIDAIRFLYARREANSPKGTPEFSMLRLARLQADRLASGYKKNSLGLPTFLLGGAILSSITSAVVGVGEQAAGNKPLLVVVVIVFALVALAAFWVILTAAAIARRRCRIALDHPLRALWETIGAAGAPPKDDSRQFATYAVILLVLAWVAVPALIGILAFR